MRKKQVIALILSASLCMSFGSAVSIFAEDNSLPAASQTDIEGPRLQEDEVAETKAGAETKTGAETKSGAETNAGAEIKAGAETNAGTNTNAEGGEGSDEITDNPVEKKVNNTVVSPSAQECKNEKDSTGSVSQGDSGAADGSDKKAVKTLTRSGEADTKKQEPAGTETFEDILGSAVNYGVKAGGFCPELTGTFCPHSAGISVRHPGRSRQWHL